MTQSLFNWSRISRWSWRTPDGMMARYGRPDRLLRGIIPALSARRPVITENRRRTMAQAYFDAV
jgi:hypothetical protein